MFSAKHAHTHALRAALGLACACASGPPREDVLHEAFERIQVHEANIERQRPLSTDPEAPCTTRCSAAQVVCEERDALCAIAREVADADALARCEQADAECTSVHAAARAGCSCRE